MSFINMYRFVHSVCNRLAAGSVPPWHGAQDVPYDGRGPSPNTTRCTTLHKC